VISYNPLNHTATTIIDFPIHYKHICINEKNQFENFAIYRLLWPCNFLAQLVQYLQFLVHLNISCGCNLQVRARSFVPQAMSGSFKFLYIGIDVYLLVELASDVVTFVMVYKDGVPWIFRMVCCVT